MPGLNAKRFLIIFIITISAIYIISYLRLPFEDHDTLLYVIIGRALINNHILPYGYVFDHKPILLYAIYGIWTKIIPLEKGSLALLSLVSISLFANMAKHFWNLPFCIVWFSLLLFGAPFLILSGNTEMVFFPFLFGSIIFLEKPGRAAAIAGGVSIGLAAEINYISVFSIVLPAIYLAFQRARKSPLDVFLIALGTIIGFIVPLLPYLFVEKSVFLHYIGMQRLYLGHYGASPQERLLSIELFLLLSLCFAPIIFVSLKNCTKSPQRVALIWALSGVVACCASGHPFRHYFLLVLIPLSLLIASQWKTLPLRMFWISLAPAILLAGYGTIHDISHNIKLYRRIQAMDFSALHRKIGKTPVLNIQASHVPFALADLQSQTPFLFQHHVQILYGDNARAWYGQELARAPRFVMTSPQLCMPPLDMPEICAFISERYRLVRTENDEFGFALYERKPG
ncbi:hypothetical protein ABUE34_13125 [Kozakia baliensis]|uniref:hypothetical protein n=1 Tax=Kozakia baliensis TaxID=153496 RepID=UPI00345BE022